MSDKIKVKLTPLNIKESSIESKFCKAISQLGGKAYKFSSPGKRAVPDRLVIVKGLAPIFVEFKAPGKKLTAAQEREHKFLKSLDQVVFVVNSFGKVDSLISYIKKYKAI